VVVGKRQPRDSIYPHLRHQCSDARPV